MLILFRTKRPSAIVSVEILHFFTGICLILCGMFSYVTEGMSMMLSWTIFGAMYVSMSDIGEEEMSSSKRESKRHQMRVIFAYVGALLSIILLIHSLLFFLSI